MNSNWFLNLNGKPVKESEARISPVNRGIMYGDGCFETFRSYQGRFLGFEDHFQRLQEGGGYLSMDLPFSASELKQQILEILHVNDLKQQEAILRLQIWRKGGRGYTPDSAEAEWMIQASYLPSGLDQPVSLWVAQTRCIPSQSLKRSIKLSNGLNYIKAAAEARGKSCDDALMLTIDEKVSETTSANIFWVKGDMIFTPDKSCDLLPGVTRDIVLNICRNQGFETEEGSYNIENIQEAEAVFRTNSLIEIQAVKSVNDISFDAEHPFIKELKKLFNKYRQEHVKI